ncbi:MAG: TIGR03435 family protein [Acidobacteria bacterium]|nr:TIGR03435 family protein [Acidobacteriota bacterium]
MNHFLGILLAAAEVFEVASVKPAGPEARGIVMQFTPGGGVRIGNGNLKQILTLAYGVERFQISGGPGWVDSDRFEIVAKGAADGIAPSEEQRLARVRLRALLAERFGLVVRRESKEGTIYALSVAKNGHKLKGSDKGFDGLSGRPGQLTGERASMEQFAGYLTGQLGKPVWNETGLTGTYAFQLSWTPENAGPLAADKAAAVGAPAPDPSGSSLFQAIQDQLGLRLQAKRGPVETIVIERAEKPTAN